MNIVYSSSDYYAECTGVSLWGLYANNKDIEDINVYIVDTDISDNNKKKFLEVANNFGRKLHIIPAKDGLVQGSKKLGLGLMRGALNTYARVLMNTWLYGIDKVIVIDSDTLVTGKLIDLWNLEMNEYLIAAVPDVAIYGTNCNIEDSALIDGVETYFNMGICMINLKQWRKMHVDNYLYKLISAEKPIFRTADQSLINRYLNKYIMRIHLKYNFYSPVHKVRLKTIDQVFCKKKIFYSTEYDEATESPSIIHYFGHPFERPWYKHNAAYNKIEYLKTRQLTPWASNDLKKWEKENNIFLIAYDCICYLMLKMGMRETCLKLRYILGQKLKGKKIVNR